MRGIGYGSMWKELLEIKQFLPAAPPVDLRQWLDPSIGWGLVLGEPDEPRGSRPVLREAGGGIPPAYSPDVFNRMYVSSKVSLRRRDGNRALFERVAVCEADHR